MSFQSTSEGLRCRRADGVSSGPGPSSKAREDQRSSLQRVGRREGSLLLSRAFCQASSGLDEAHALSASTMSSVCLICKQPQRRTWHRVQPTSWAPTAW